MSKDQNRKCQQKSCYKKEGNYRKNFNGGWNIQEQSVLMRSERNKVRTKKDQKAMLEVHK